MAEINETPFPTDFYKEDGWVKSLVGFYGNGKNKLPVGELQRPMEMLTKSMYDVTFIYGLFPDVVYRALGQVINPLFEPQEYHERIYMELKTAGEDENRPLLVKYSEAIYTIRRMFEREKDFYQKNFVQEIKNSPGEGDASRYELFSSTISDITKKHVIQIRKIIEGR